MLKIFFDVDGNKLNSYVHIIYINGVSFEHILHNMCILHTYIITFI